MSIRTGLTSSDPRRHLWRIADLSELATGPCNDMVVEALGRAYIGNFGFDRLLARRRARPASSASIRTISIGDRTAFTCMLGGRDRRTLFLCTSTGSGPAMARKRDGKIEIVPVDVPGAGLP